MTRYFIAIESTPEINPLTLTDSLLQEKHNASESLEYLRLFLYRTKFINVRDEKRKFWILEVDIDEAHCEIDVRQHLKRTATQTKNFLIKITDARAIKKIISQQSYSFTDLAMHARGEMSLTNQPLLAVELRGKSASNDSVYHANEPDDSGKKLTVADVLERKTKETSERLNIQVDDTSEFSPLIEIESRNHFRSNRYQQLIRWYERNQIFKRLLFKVTQAEHSLGRQYVANNFANGFYFAVKNLWPVALMGLITHDLVNYYSYPSQRYGEKWNDLLLGMSGNEYSYSSNLGSYLINNANYWLWLGCVFATPPIVGLLNVPINYLIFRRIFKPISEVESQSLRNIFELNAAYHAILWDNNLPAIKRQELFNEICDAAYNNSYFATSLLAELSDSLQIGINSDVLTNLKKSALTNLHALNPGRNIYRNYLLWSLGQSNKKLWHFFSGHWYCYVTQSLLIL